MTLLLVSWLLFAPVFLVLRWAVLPRGARRACARSAQSPDHVARALYISKRLLDGAFTHAARASEAGVAVSAEHMRACLRQGTDAMVRDLRSNIDSWADATATLGGAPFMPPLPARQLHSPPLRALAWADLAGHFAVVGAIGRLRMRLTILRAMLTVFLWSTRQLPTSVRDLEAARADLAVLLDEACYGHRAIADAPKLDARGRLTGGRASVAASVAPARPV